MAEAEKAIFEKTAKIYQETQALIEVLRKDLAALRAKAARAEAYNEIATTFLARAKREAASNFDDQYASY